MGLTQVINVANTGLSATEAGLEIIARNVANADTPGYTRKSQDLHSLVADGQSMGVRIGDVTRVVNEFLQTELRGEISNLSSLNTKKQFVDRLDELFGQPGGANALDTILNNFTDAIQQLTTSPDDFTVRQTAVADAQGIAAQLRTLSTEIQDLRQLAEDSLAQGVNEVNDVLSQLETLNTQLTDFAHQTPPPDILDERDKLLGRLSEYMSINVQTDSIGRATVTSSSGNTLLQAQGDAVHLAFDQRGIVNAETLYNTDENERGVGTIKLISGSGGEIDLIQQGSMNSGRLGALIEMRDDILVEAQTQLDELAHNLALALSTRDAVGTAATSGAQEGFEVDLTGLQAGNQITVNYTEGGTEKTLTIVRVDDASQLPLSNDVTADPNDTVLGVDFSGGTAGIVAAIQTALGGDLTVSNPSGEVLRILDDGAAGNTDVNSLSAGITVTALQDDGTALPLFTDGGLAYTGSLDGGSQKLGFAARIDVNALIVADNELLVRYQSSPETPIGDPDRPLDLLNRLTERQMTFDPDAGIGQSSRPYTGAVANYGIQIVSFQGAQAEQITREYGTQEIVTFTLQDRYDSSVGVNVDQELSDLITLQNAYAANARIIQTASDLMQLLLQL